MFGSPFGSLFQRPCPMCAALVEDMHHHFAWHKSQGHDMRQATADALKAEGEAQMKSDIEAARSQAATEADAP